MTEMTPSPRSPIHPLWLRLTHWLNALAVLVMVASGWRIYNASPLFDFRFANDITLGGWLGGAIQWHFAAMWLLAANGLLYLLLNVLAADGCGASSCRSRRGPCTPTSRPRCTVVFPMRDPRRYNAVQRAAYLFVMLDILLLVLSGLVLWKSVQFPLLRELLGGYDTARYVHFFAMAGLVGFTAVHLVMVMLVPRTLLTMIRGH